MLKKLFIGAVAAAMSYIPLSPAFAEDSVFIPFLSYRTGPFAAGGTVVVNGFQDYMTLLNERDGGIGGAKVLYEECETAYNAQKGVECYEATKNRHKGALVSTPMSTGITLQLIPKAPVDEIVVLSMGYGLSAAAIGEKFPWVFTYPTSYWQQATAILKYIHSQTGLEGQKIGYIYLDVGYGKEPIPVFEQLAEEFGYELVKFPVAGKDMQSQSSHWLSVRRERPDWMIMWGWGAMNPTAIKEAAKIRFPMNRFIGNWWASAHVDLRPVGKAGTGYLGANFSGVGTDFPVFDDIQKHVISKGLSQSKPEDVGSILYNRGMYNAVLIAEGIAVAQRMTGKKSISGADLRLGLENINLDAARLRELGLDDFAPPLKGSCKDHGGGGPIFMQQWNGEDWERITDYIYPMNDVVQPMLEKAAADYIADKPGWETQTC